MRLYIDEFCTNCFQVITEKSEARELFCRCPMCLTPLEPLVRKDEAYVSLGNLPTVCEWAIFEKQPQLEARYNISRQSHYSQLALDGEDVPVTFLHEYNHSTGSWKDREVPFTLARVFRDGFEDFCLASGSNAAIAFGKAAVDLGIGRNAHLFIPKHAELRVIASLEELGVDRFMLDLHVIDGDSDMAGKAAHYWANEKKHPLCSGWPHWGRRLGLALMWRDYQNLEPSVYFQGVAGALGMWGVVQARPKTHLVFCQPDVCAPFVDDAVDAFGVIPKPINGPVVCHYAPVLNARNVALQREFFRAHDYDCAVVDGRQIVDAMHFLWDNGFDEAGLEAGTAYAGYRAWRDFFGDIKHPPDIVVNLSGVWRPGDWRVVG